MSHLPYPIGLTQLLLTENMMCQGRGGSGDVRGWGGGCQGGGDDLPYTMGLTQLLLTGGVWGVRGVEVSGGRGRDQTYHTLWD